MITVKPEVLENFWLYFYTFVLQITYYKHGGIMPRSFKTLNDFELINEFFMSWTGAHEMFKSGLSGNPRAANLDSVCLHRFGEKNWDPYEDDTFYQKLQKQYETFEKKAKSEHPNLKPIENTYAGIHRIANYAMKDFTPWLKENLPLLLKSNS